MQQCQSETSRTRIRLLIKSAKCTTILMPSISGSFRDHIWLLQSIVEFFFWSRQGSVWKVTLESSLAPPPSRQAMVFFSQQPPFLRFSKVLLKTFFVHGMRKSAMKKIGGWAHLFVQSNDWWLPCQNHRRQQ